MAKVYTEKQWNLMQQFFREAETLTQCWNQHKNDQLHEQSRDQKIKEYLIKLLKK